MGEGELPRTSADPPHPRFTRDLSPSGRGERIPHAATRIAPALLRYDRCDLRRWGSAVIRNNVLYLVIGALAVAVAVLSYQLYQDRHEPKGVHIDVGPGGLSIQGK